MTDERTDSSSSSASHERFVAVLAKLMRAIDAGEATGPHEWITKHPEFATELREFFQKNERVEQLVRPLRQAAANALHVRCPHCHNPIELLDQAPLSDISCPSCGSNFSLIADNSFACDPSTKAFGHFELLDQVGIGQFGSVWRGRDTKLDRTVAIKIPRNERMDSDQTEMFLRDARAAAQLTHPNIVSVHEVGKQDNTVYIVSDFVQGVTLKEWTEATRLPPREAAELCINIANALHHAHEAGVIHRDLKPSNIMMDTVGEPHLVDFGLAKREAGEITMTVEGQILGTPAYMSPEQARGEGHTADRRADIYSLGVILFELLTGELPFRGDKQMLLVQILKDDPPSPRKLNKSVPRDLETICLKCLEKGPSRRYASADAVVADLSRWLNGQSIGARRSNVIERTAKWARREPAIAALVVVSIAAVIVVVAGLTISNMLVAGQQRKTLDVLFHSYLDQARAQRLSGRNGQRFESLRVLTKASELMQRLRLGEDQLLHLRNEAIACIALADMQVSTKQVTSQVSGELNFIDFDSTLTHYTHWDDGALTVCRVEDNREVARLTGLPTTPVISRFSPDGQLLAVKLQTDSPIQLRVWNWRRRKPILTLTREDYQLSEVAIDFSPDSQFVSVGCVDGAVHLLNVSTGSKRCTLQADARIFSVRYDPSGKFLATTCLSTSTLLIWDVEKESLVQRYQHPEDHDVYGIAWRSDGEYLAVGGEKVIYVWAADEPQQPQRVLRGHSWMVEDVAYHPHENLLVSHGWRDGSTRLWNLDEDRQVVSMSGHFSRFSPDGRWLSYRTGSEIGLWEVATGIECRRTTLARNTTMLREMPCFFPDGRVLAVPGEHGVDFWDLVAWQPLGQLPLGKTWTALFDREENCMITGGHLGLHAWPVEYRGDSSTRSIRIGPPLDLDVPPNIAPYDLSMSRNGTLLITDALSEGRAMILDRKRDRRAFLDGPGDLRHTSLSPDGHWVATGNYAKSGFEIWDAKNGELLRQLPSQGSGEVQFSPDQQWLVTCSPTEYRFWRVGTWEPKHMIPRRDVIKGGTMTFDPDSQILAITHTPYSVQLVDVPSGLELATLTMTPRPDRIVSMAFNADGSKLAIVSEPQGAFVWDVRRLRQELDAMRLDWNSAKLLPMSSSEASNLNVEVQLGSLQTATD